ncbi:uncharacterized protein [Sinocyclocheilus grahami]|uniref:uncharacterized protein n=1 Tax=Sinocyclocheilus grahami TaxID=75366 RepID=UPI0007AC9012|nr:PREDICTED: uncharacterized protein LOC107600510 [Sinocyclocheilus grahami]
MRAHLRNPSFFIFPTACFFILFLAISNVHSAAFYGQIEEGAPPGTLVAGFLFPLGDKCKELNLAGLKTVLTGEDSSDFSLEYLDNAGFVLKTTKTFDRESKSSYSVSARLPRCSKTDEEVSVKIEILDKNNNTRQFNVTTDRIEILTDVKSRVRKPRTVSEEVSYTVTVSEDVKVGDLIFTVPDQKFEKKWFEVVSDGNSPVQMERDSGRVYLAYRLMSTAEVMVKIHNMREHTPATTERGALARTSPFYRTTRQSVLG